MITADSDGDDGDSASDATSVAVHVLIIVHCVITVATTLFGAAQIWTHAQLISSGMTTNETANLLRYTYFRDAQGNLRNPFAKGYLRNWGSFLFGTCFSQLRSSETFDIEAAPILINAIQKALPEKHSDEQNKEQV